MIACSQGWYSSSGFRVLGARLLTGEGGLTTLLANKKGKWKRKEEEHSRQVRER